MSGRVIWLAGADARGHVMRAHLMSRLLGSRGVEVEVLTTSEDGREFLAAMGTRAAVFSRHFQVRFDARQNISRLRTEANVLSYLLFPGRFRADLRRLQSLASGADLVVNDFHPMLLAAPLLEGAGKMPIVHVYGENLWRATERNFEGRWPLPLDVRYRKALQAVRDRAFACVEHSLSPLPSRGRAFRVPPIVSAPARSREAVRAALGLLPRDKLAAVYLNPHFREAWLPDALEAALARAGYRVHAIGEGFEGRPGWTPRDPHFADVVAAADLLASAPGMGSLGQVRLFGTPFLALATDQPEQEANLAFLRDVPASRAQVVPAGRQRPSLGRELAEAIARLSPDAGRPSPELAVEGLHRCWADLFCKLIHATRGETAHVAS